MKDVQHHRMKHFSLPSGWSFVIREGMVEILRVFLERAVGFGATIWRERLSPWGASSAGRGMSAGVLLLAHALALYAFIGALALPWLAKAVLERDISRLLHRPVSVGSLRMNPFTFEVAVRSFVVMEPDGNHVFLGFDRFEVNLDLALAINHYFAVNRLLLEKPVVRLARNAEGALNFADLLPVPSPGSQQTQEVIELLPPGVRLVLRDITVSGGTVLFEDDLAGAKQELKDLQFSIALLTSDQSGLREAFTAGGTLNESNILLTVKADPFAKSPEAEARLTMKNVALSRYSPYLPTSNALELGIAEVGAWARVRFPGLQAGQSVPVLEGNARLAGITMGSGDKTAVRMESFEVHGVGLDLEKAQFSVDRVDINTPDIQLVRDPQGVLNLLALLDKGVAETAEAHSPASAHEPNKASRPPAVPAGEQGVLTESGPGPSEPQTVFPDVRVGEVVVKNAHMEIDDQAIGAKTVFKGINGSLNGLELAAGFFDSLHLECGGEIFDHLKLQAKGSFEPLHIWGTIALDGLELVKPGAVLKHVLPKLAFSGRAGVDARFSLSELHGEVLPKISANVTVDNLHLGQEGQPPLVAAHKLSLAGLNADAAARTVSLDQARLVGADIHLVRDTQGGFVLPQAFTATAGHDGREAAWQWRVKDIEIETATVELADAKAQAVYTAELEKAGVNSLDSGMEKPVSVHAQGRLGQMANFSVSGDVALKLQSAKLRLDVSNLPLGELARLGPPLPVAVKQGELRLAGDLSASFVNGVLLGGFSGDMGLKGLQVAASGDGRDLLRLTELAMTGIQSNLSPLELRAASLTLTEPVVFLEVDKDGMPVLPGVASPVLREAGASAAETVPASPPAGAGPGKQTGGKGKLSAKAGPGAPPTAAGPGKPASATGPAKPGLAFAYGLGTLTLQGGRLELSARGFEPPLAASISSIQALLTDIKPDQPVKVSMSATVGQAGKFKADGQAGWVAAAPMLDLRATLENMDLGELSPVSQKFTGFPITRGKLGLQLDYKAGKSALNLKNKIIVMGIQLGRKTAVPGGKDVPLDLAVSLLADNKGVIDLDIPITGDAGKMKVDLQDVISTAMAGAFAKILFSPLAFLNVGHGGGRTAVVAFVPGSAELTAEGRKTLSDLVQAIANRPRLNLEVMAYVDYPAEAEALGLALAQAQAAKAPQAAVPPEAPASRKSIFTKPAPKQAAVVTDQVPPPPVAKTASAEEAQNLARQRLEAVRQYLSSQGKLSEQRIFPMAGDHLVPPKLQGAPGSRADVTLRQ